MMKLKLRALDEHKTPSALVREAALRAIEASEQSDRDAA